MSDFDNPAVVIDIGSGTTKVGISGDDAPSAVFSSAIDGRQSPIEHGIIQNWENIGTVLNHAFSNELSRSASDQPLLLTESPSCGETHREKCAQIAFDEFNVPAYFSSGSATLSLYAAGRTTGLVLESGEGVTYCVPIFEGFTRKTCNSRVDFAGGEVTDYFLKLLGEAGHNVSREDKSAVKEMKEEICYVSQDYKQELKNFDIRYDIKEYTLPDGRKIDVGPERFQAAELLFKPSLNGLDGDGIHKELYVSIERSDTDTRIALSNNIILAGGNTLLEGLAQRLQSEMQALRKDKVRVYAPPERKHSVWIGGSIISSLSTFTSSAITREEYLENGVSIVHRKIF